MQSTCTFDGCDKPALAKGLCNGHYIQQWRGQELRPLLSQVTLEQRFWQKVRKTERCWVWTAVTDSGGYGQIRADGCMRPAHRISWEMANGPIPEGVDLDHRCANRKCVNPDHMRVTTRSQNGQHRTGANKNSTSGVRGVSWHKDKNAWQAYAKLNGRRYHGGYHPTIEAADAAARTLRARLHSHDDYHEWVSQQDELA